MNRIDDPRTTYEADEDGITPFARTIPCEPRWLRGQYMAKLVEQDINILGLSSTYMHNVGDDDRHYTEYYVYFEYAIMQGAYKRWAKMALPIHVSMSDTNHNLPLPCEQIYGEVLCVVEEARKLLGV